MSWQHCGCPAIQCLEKTQTKKKTTKTKNSNIWRGRDYSISLKIQPWLVHPSLWLQGFFSEKWLNSSYMSFSKILNFTKPQFPHLQNGTTTFLGVIIRNKDVVHKGIERSAWQRCFSVLLITHQALNQEETFWQHNHLLRSYCVPGTLLTTPHVFTSSLQPHEVVITFILQMRELRLKEVSSCPRSYS